MLSVHPKRFSFFSFFIAESDLSIISFSLVSVGCDFPVKTVFTCFIYSVGSAVGSESLLADTWPRDRCLPLAVFCNRGLL